MQITKLYFFPTWPRPLLPTIGIPWPTIYYKIWEREARSRGKPGCADFDIIT